MITDLVPARVVGNVEECIDEQGHHARLIQSVVEFADDGVLIAVLEPYDELRIVWANAAFAEFSGTPAPDLIGRRMNHLSGNVSDPAVFERIHRALRGDASFREESVIFDRALGREVLVEVCANRIPSPDQSSGQFAAIVYRKLSGRTGVLKKQPELAFHDALTDLPNRALFLNRVSHAINRTRRPNEGKSTVLCLGIDQFKLINDSCGHRMGDILLVAMARRLEKLLRPGDTLARVDGDEFCILLDGDAAAGERVAQRVFDAFAAPFTLGARELFVTASIGIAATSADYRGPLAAEELMRDADIAMCRAKKTGKSRYAVFQPSFRAESMRRLQLQNDLRLAIERGEISVYYQPIFTVESRRLRGFEALLRWKHSELGFVSPVEFIPIAEESGLIVRLGTWTLHEACRQVREWQLAYPELGQLGISVNVSAKQIIEEPFGDIVLAALDQWNLGATSLHIELTEGILMSDPERVTLVLQQLRAAGIEVHIDDFGTGYSSLAYLRQFTVDTLKIDKSFVSGAGTPGLSNPQIVKTIIDLAQQLGLEVIAEGVETPEQAAALAALRCTHTQGYLHAKALSAEAMPTFLEHVRQAILQAASDSDGNSSPSKPQ